MRTAGDASQSVRSQELLNSRGINRPTDLPFFWKTDNQWPINQDTFDLQQNSP